MHPAADLFPMMGAVELQALADDIKANGLQSPVVVTADGMVLDGRNRLVACRLADVEPTLVVYDGVTPLAFVMSANVHRRHLTPGQLGEAGRLLKIAAKADPTLRPPLDPGAKGHARELTAWAAQVVGASRAAVEQVERVYRDAPDLHELVVAGTLSIDSADSRRKRRVTVAAEQDAREVALAPVTVDASGPGWRMFAGRFQDRLADLPDGSVDLIVTDPPYPAESLPLWSDLAEHAARVLKPQGILVALSGKILLPDVMARLATHLVYGWQYTQPMTSGNQSRILARQVIQSSKPWLAYSNGTWPSGCIDWHSDMLCSSVMNKSEYRWAQSADPARELIEHLCPKGGLVLDPFTGTGTYGHAALDAGRQFIGVEADAERFDGTVASLSKREVAP